MRTLRRLLRNVAQRAGYDVIRRQPPVILMRGDEVARALTLEHVMSLVNDVPGDVVECGVGRGATFMALALIARAERRGRHVWGFDSFQGFPDPSPEDDSPRHPARGELCFGSAADVAEVIRRSGVDRAFFDSNCHLVPGFFEATLPAFTGSIALLHLDVDLYRSYHTCLDALYPKVSPGGVVLFDEYTDPNFPGARRAVDEYLGDRIRDLGEDPFRNARYFVKPREGSG